MDFVSFVKFLRKKHCRVRRCALERRKLRNIANFLLLDRLDVAPDSATEYNDTKHPTVLSQFLRILRDSIKNLTSLLQVVEEDDSQQVTSR